MSDSQYYDPVTHDLYVDPILTPCCGQALSRHVLCNWFESQRRKGTPLRCPMCNDSDKIIAFNPMQAPKVVYIADQVEKFAQDQGLEIPEPHFLIDESDHESDHESDDESDSEPKKKKAVPHADAEEEWNATYCPIRDPSYEKSGRPSPLSNLRLEVRNSKFEVKRGLTIVVADRSGSMNGNPWRQVETALLKIDELRRQYNCAELEIIGYDGRAERIDVSGDRQTVEHTIRHMYTGGGTMFGQAFQKIEEVLRDYYYSEDLDAQNDPRNVDSIDIIFMTDGQAGDSNRPDLPNQFRQILERSWTRRITVHTVGFSRYCDKQLLEDLRKSGSEEGTFRYAEPEDGDDELTNKVMNLFELTSSAFSVDLTLTLEHACFLNGEASQTIRFPISSDGTGTQNLWIRTEPDYEPILRIDQTDRLIPIALDINAEQAGWSYYDSWVSYQVDLLAQKVFELNALKDTTTYNSRLTQFHAAILGQKAQLLLNCARNETISDRIQFILEQIDLIQGGSSVDIGRLGDMRYASQFKTSKTANKSTKSSKSVSRSLPSTSRPLLANEQAWLETQIFYQWGSDGMNRNLFQKFVMSRRNNRIDSKAQQMIDSLQESDLTYRDLDGNTALHLMAYAGQNQLLEVVLQKFPNLNVNVQNDRNDTPIVMAIKRYGHHKCVKVLIDHNADIPGERKNGLEEFARSLGFQTTAALVENFGDLSTTINMGTKVEYIDTVYARAQAEGAEIDVPNYLHVCLAKCHVQMVRTLIRDHQAIPTFEQLMQFCVPPQVDDPEADKYVEMARLVLEVRPDFIHQVDQDNETILHRAVTSGNLPSVKFFIEAGCDLEARNELGNTALWLACAKRYPCIVEELLNQGADPNARNEKGDTPMYPICQYGPPKVADTMLSFGAQVDNINRNGDTLILISCRNGQFEILKSMLPYVSMDFINRKAEIDGFNAIMASAEAGHGDCIRVLHSHGVDIEQKTDDDNQIIKGATPLQIAIYYSKIEAVYALLESGADPNCRDLFNMTALHHAVLKGNIPIIQMVAKYGGDFTLEDRHGNRPLFYCRDSKVKKALLPRSLEPLMSLARGEFGDDTDRALEILQSSKLRVDGCMIPRDVLDCRDSEGNTPLLISAIYSNNRVYTHLLHLGADPLSTNDYGMSGYLWVLWNKNSQLLEVTPVYTREREEYPEMVRLDEASKSTRLSRTILFLGRPPTQIQIPRTSGFLTRMQGVTNVLTSDSELNLTQMITESNDTVIISKLSETISDPNLIFHAKVHVIHTIARYPNLHLNPENLAILTLYLNNALLFQETNRAIMDYATNQVPISSDIQRYLNGLTLALNKCDTYEGTEVYIGVDKLDRSKFIQGTEVVFPTLLSASTSWHVALEGAPRFEEKRKGVVFILKTRSAKYVTPYAPFGTDAEVMLIYPTRFKVSRWYRGDPICLGQANIREHTFGVKETDLLDYQNSDRALIIELEEI